jgi:hypothetical protein
MKWLLCNCAAKFCRELKVAQTPFRNVRKLPSLICSAKPQKAVSPRRSE